MVLWSCLPLLISYSFCPQQSSSLEVIIFLMGLPEISFLWFMTISSPEWIRLFQFPLITGCRNIKRCLYNLLHFKHIRRYSHYDWGVLTQSNPRLDWVYRPIHSPHEWRRSLLRKNHVAEQKFILPIFLLVIPKGTCIHFFRMLVHCVKRNKWSVSQ